MTVYKYFIKIALKNKWVIISYTLIFMLLSIINGANTSIKDESFIETKLTIGIIDNSNSELSKGLKNYLSKKNYITKMLDDEEYIKEQIFLEAADAVVIIPEDFEEKFIFQENSIELFKDDRKIGSYQIQNQINKYLGFVNATYENGNYDLEKVNIALDENAKVLVTERSNIGNINAEIWFNYYFNFTSYIIIAVYIGVLGLVMTDFSDENIESRRKISSKKFLQFNKEMYLGQLSVAALITLIFIIGSIVLKGEHIGEVNFAKYVINTIIFSFSILCLTFLINNLTNNKFVKNGLSTVLSLGTSFISGVMVPQELLGEKVLTIAKFFPSYYFVKANNMNINSFLDIRYELLMQILFALAFLLMGLYFSKIKQKA